MPITSTESFIGTPSGRMMSPIMASRTGNSRAGPSFGSSENPVTSCIECAAHIEEQPRARRSVMPALAQRLEQRVARQLRHEVTGQPADRAERRGAWRRRAGAPFVVVAVADHADAKALLECVVQNPFERAPGRMHLDGALDAPVMGIFDIGIASAHMRDDAAVFAAQELRTACPRCRSPSVDVSPSTRMCDERRIGRPSRRKKMLRSPPMPVLPDHS